MPFMLEIAERGQHSSVFITIELHESDDDGFINLADKLMPVMRSPAFVCRFRLCRTWFRAVKVQVKVASWWFEMSTVEIIFIIETSILVREINDQGKGWRVLLSRN
jgi:hypothetical protein